MTDQTAIVAEIRPGMKPALEKRLQEGPPFDLAAEGFERHEVFIGDKDVVFVFTGPGAVSQLARMAATPALFRHVLAMTGLLAAPRLRQCFGIGRADAVKGSEPIARGCGSWTERECHLE